MTVGARLARWPSVTLALLGLLAPASRAADPGTISGTIDPAAKVSAIFAIDRTNDRRYPGSIDGEGRFTIKGLPTGASYDCIVDVPGARLEGVSLRVAPSEFEDDPPLSDDDVATIRSQVRRLNKFEDEVEVLAISGNAQHAAVLLNKLRTRPFVNSKPGEVVWRAELWHFDRPEETWVKSLDELFLVLYRERLAGAAYRAKSITFDPALGGLSPTAETPTIDLGRIEPPPTRPGVRLRSSGEAKAKRSDPSG